MAEENGQEVDPATQAAENAPANNPDAATGADEPAAQ